MDSLFKFIAWIVSEAYAIFGSYGLSIVLLTLIVMAITTPLTIKGTKSMIQMQRLQPELKKIQERHRDDREKMNQELLAFYKANNINPVGGCLPMFIQLPVFAVLYRVVRGLTQRETVIGLQTGRTAGDLRDNLAIGRSVIPKNGDLPFKPGYISKTSELYDALIHTTKMKSWGVDLADSASSALSKSIGHALPYLLLIAIVAVTGVVQQRQIQGRSNASSQVNSQQQAIMKIMPFFLPVISFGLPAALVIYFVISNLWRVGQQAFITRTLYNKPHPEPVILDTVATETPAVSNFTSPLRRYSGTWNVTTSIRCVNPQPTMNAPNIQKTHGNGKSRRRRMNVRILHRIDDQGGTLHRAEPILHPVVTDNMMACGGHRAGAQCVDDEALQEKRVAFRIERLTAGPEIDQMPSVRSRFDVVDTAFHMRSGAPFRVHHRAARQNQCANLPRRQGGDLDRDHRAGMMPGHHEVANAERIETGERRLRPHLDRRFVAIDRVGFPKTEGIDGDRPEVAAQQGDDIFEFPPGPWRLMQQQQRKPLPADRGMDSAERRFDKSVFDF